MKTASPPKNLMVPICALLGQALTLPMDPSSASSRTDFVFPWTTPPPRASYGALPEAKATPSQVNPQFSTA